MATEIRKSANIFKDLLGLVSTSRTVQLGIVLFVAAAIAATMISRKFSQHFGAKDAAKLAQQKALSNKETFENSLFRFPESPGSQPLIALGTDLSSLPKPLQEAFHNHVEKLLAGQSGADRIAPDILLPAFYADGYFSAVNAGDLKILEYTKFFNRIPRLVTVTPQAIFADSTSVRDMRTCRLTLTVRMMQAKGATRDMVQIKATAAGFSDEASLDKAFQSIPPDQLNQLKPLLQ